MKRTFLHSWMLPRTGLDSGVRNMALRFQAETIYDLQSIIRTPDSLTGGGTQGAGVTGGVTTHEGASALRGATDIGESTGRGGVAGRGGATGCGEATSFPLLAATAYRAEKKCQ